MFAFSDCIGIVRRKKQCCESGLRGVTGQSESQQDGDDAGDMVLSVNQIGQDA